MTPNSKHLILAGAAIGATALVVLGARAYRQRVPKELDLDEGTEPQRHADAAAQVMLRLELKAAPAHGCPSFL